MKWLYLVFLSLTLSCANGKFTGSSGRTGGSHVPGPTPPADQAAGVCDSDERYEEGVKENFVRDTNGFDPGQVIRDACPVDAQGEPYNGGGYYTSPKEVTRTAVCQLLGFQKSTETYASNKLSSPGNDTNYIYSPEEKQFSQISSKSDGKRVLVSLECSGKLKPICKDRILIKQGLSCK